MYIYTLIISIAASILVFVLTPIYGIVLYIATLAWYPAYLTVKVGSIDFSLCRIVIIAIWVKLLTSTTLPKQFRFIWLDKFIIIFFLCEILAGSITTPLLILLENRAGAFFDSALPYFAVRMIVTDKQKYLRLLKYTLFMTAPLAVFGLYECLTGHNPFGFLKAYHAWREGLTYQPTARYGFFRAQATFTMSIMFGLFFAMLGPPCAGLLLNIKKGRLLVVSCTMLMGLGAFSSVSSGPVLAAFLAAVFIAFYRWRRYWKPVTILIVLMCIAVEIISNRHFYDVLGRFTFSPHTAWYRSKLINVALFEGGMSGHWVFGYGLFDPGWGPRLDMREFTDMVNHYLKVLCCYGLVGFLPFMGIITAAVKNIADAYRNSISNADKWLVWCLGGTFFGTLPALVTVSLFGQPYNVFHIVLAFAGAMPFVIERENSSILLKTQQ